jgi:serine/threonine protein kinase
MEMGSGDVYDLPQRNPEIDLRIMRTAIEGTALLHILGYCYADLKPDNILFFTDNKAVITHFTLIDFNTTFHHSRPQDAKYGTTHWMSPELFNLVDRADKTIDFDYRKSDYWSIGCLAYYLLTGNHFIKASSIDEYRKEITHLECPSPPTTTLGPVGDILASIMVSTLHIDPNNRIFEPNQTLQKIYTVLGIQDVPPSVPLSVPHSDSEFDQLSDLDEDSDSDFETAPGEEDSPMANTAVKGIHLGSSIYTVLASLIKTSLYSSELKDTIDIEKEIETIIDTTRSIVRKNMKQIQMYFDDILIISKDIDDDLLEFLEQQWYILTLNYTVRIYNHTPPLTTTVYSAMEEYLINSQAHSDPDTRKQMAELTNRMIFDRCLHLLLELELEIEPIPQPIPRP